MAGNLPTATSGIRGVSFNNQIIMTGNSNNIWMHLRKPCKILQEVPMKKIIILRDPHLIWFNITSNTWVTVAFLKTKRSMHGVSTVSVNNVIDFCKQ